MKLYIAGGEYVGTQAEAKKLDRDFEQVDVPTDKEGLIAYLNSVVLDIHPALVAEDARRSGGAVSTRVVESVEEILSEFVCLGGGDDDTIREFAERIADIEGVNDPDLDLDAVFEAQPIAHQLTLAALAVENARDAIGPLKVENNEVDPFA